MAPSDATKLSKDARSDDQFVWRVEDELLLLSVVDRIWGEGSEVVYKLSDRVRI
jgi:hypothetical protein